MSTIQYKIPVVTNSYAHSEAGHTATGKEKQGEGIMIQSSAQYLSTHIKHKQNAIVTEFFIHFV